MIRLVSLPITFDDQSEDYFSPRPKQDPWFKDQAKEYFQKVQNLIRKPADYKFKSLIPYLEDTLYQEQVNDYTKETNFKPRKFFDSYIYTTFKCKRDPPLILFGNFSWFSDFDSTSFRKYVMGPSNL